MIYNVLMGMLNPAHPLDADEAHLLVSGFIIGPAQPRFTNSEGHTLHPKAV